MLSFVFLPSSSVKKKNRELFDYSITRAKLSGQLARSFAKFSDFHDFYDFFWETLLSLKIL